MFPLSNGSSTCREGGQLCVIILSNHVVRQYRACVVDLLGLGIHMCGVYYSIMRTTHPDLSAFFLCHPYNIPLSNLMNFSFTCPLSFYAE